MLDRVLDPRETYLDLSGRHAMLLRRAQAGGGIRIALYLVGEKQ